MTEILHLRKRCLLRNSTCELHFETSEKCSERQAACPTEQSDKALWPDRYDWIKETLSINDKGLERIAQMSRLVRILAFHPEEDFFSHVMAQMRRTVGKLCRYFIYLYNVFRGWHF